jgi:hypothetical protein
VDGSAESREQALREHLDGLAHSLSIALLKTFGSALPCHSFSKSGVSSDLSSQSKDLDSDVLVSTEPSPSRVR